MGVEVAGITTDDKVWVIVETRCVNLEFDIGHVEAAPLGANLGQ